MHTGEAVCQIVLGQHDLCDLCEVLRLVLFYPQDLRSGESGEGDIGGVRGELFLSDDIVQIVRLLPGAAVVPEDGGADHVILRIQHHEAVHLTAEGDPCHLGSVLSVQQFLQSLQGLLIPVLGLLLRPPGMREKEGIFLGDDVQDLSFRIHEKELDGTGTQIDSDIQHNDLL